MKIGKRLLGLGALILGFGYLLWVDVPPSEVTIMAGPNGGFFQVTAELLKRRLAAEYGITMHIRQREDTLNIIADVNDPKSRVDLGFIAQDIKDAPRDQVGSMGSIIMEPLFVFCRQDAPIKSFADMKGLRLAVSPPRSGTRILAEDVLKLYGITDANTALLPLNLQGSLKALEDGSADAAFFLLASQTPIVSKMGSDPRLRIVDIAQSNAVTGRLGYLSPVKVYQGTFRLDPAAPATDVNTVGVPITVIAKKSLSPAISTAIGIILKDTFFEADPVSPRGTFPSMNIVRELDANRYAADVYAHEPGYAPFLYRLFPFHVAGFFEATTGLLGIAFTVILVYTYIGLPKPYEFWLRARARRLIGVLESLQGKAEAGQLTPAEQARLVRVIDEMETNIIFTGSVFKRVDELRARIATVDQSVTRTGQGSVS